MSLDIEIKKSILFMGMMGCGKSSIGREVADRLSVAFYDTDAVIEETQGVPISKIFEVRGENHFRMIEKQAVYECLKKDPCVISVGGGAVMDESTLHNITSKTTSFWIKSDLNVLLDRLDGDTSRPLIQTDNMKEKLEDLLLRRQNLYAQADIHIENNTNNIQDAVDEILGSLKDGCK